jgi:hypothetical protein
MRRRDKRNLVETLLRPTVFFDLSWKMRFQDPLHKALQLLFQQNEYSLPWSQDRLTSILLAEVRLITIVTRPHQSCLQERES